MSESRRYAAHKRGARIRVIGLADHHDPFSDDFASSPPLGSTPPHHRPASSSSSRNSTGCIHMTVAQLLASNLAKATCSSGGDSSSSSSVDIAHQHRNRTPMWIQIENGSPAALARIGAHFGLHPLTIEGIQARHTREKLEIFQHYLFLVFHALHSNSGNVGVDANRRSSTSSSSSSSSTNNMNASSFGASRSADAATDRRTRERDGDDVDDDNDGGSPTPSMHDVDIDNSPLALSSSPRRRATDRLSVAPRTSVDESSSLLSRGQSARYYGGDASTTPSTLSASPSASSFFPSLVPPRRHASNNTSTASTPAGATSIDMMRSISPSLPAASPRNNSREVISEEAPNAERFILPSSSSSNADRHTHRHSMNQQHNRSTSANSNGSMSNSESDDGSMGRRESDRSGDSDSDASAADDTTDEEADDADPLSKKPLQPSPISPTPPAPLTALIVAALSHSADVLRTSPIKLVVFPHLVLSFHSSGLGTVDVVRHRLFREYAGSVESTAWIVHAMLDSISDSLLPVVRATAIEVDTLEELIYVLSGSEHRDLLKRMGMTRRRLCFLQQRLWSKRDILMSLIGKDSGQFLAGVQIPYLRDVYDHVVTMLHQVEAASDLLGALQNTYLANVQIDVAEASNDANVVMKNLTAVGSIVLPLQLVAGLWGMNVPVPFQHGGNPDFVTLMPFFAICVGMGLVTLTMLLYFKTWLYRRE